MDTEGLRQFNVKAVEQNQLILTLIEGYWNYQELKKEVNLPGKPAGLFDTKGGEEHHKKVMRQLEKTLEMSISMPSEDDDGNGSANVNSEGSRSVFLEMPEAVERRSLFERQRQ